MTATDVKSDYIPPAGEITMFSTEWCSYCKRLKKMLASEGIGFTEIDIERTPGTADLVEQLNEGNQTVPTVLYPDGSAATNPSLNDVKRQLGV